VSQVVAFLQHVSNFGFGMLGVLAVLAWLRHRDRGNLYLALALGLLGAVSLVGEFSADTKIKSPALTLFTLAAFMTCVYALLLFRHHLLPLRRWILQAVAGLMALVTLALVPQTLSPSTGAQAKAQAAIAGIVLILVWSGAVGEPVYRLWRVSRSRPAVQRARLRALAAGYGIIILVLVFAIGASSLAGGRALDPVSSLIIELIIIAAIPVLYVSFAPPQWLRRSWRAGEEEAFNDALHDLLLDSPDTRMLADRALAWAIRLVGAEGGSMIGPDGQVLASRGLGTEAVAQTAAAPAPDRAVSPSALPNGDRVIAVPLTLTDGVGRMVVVAGSLTPVLGGEETIRLSQYSVSVAAAIDRMRLVEAVRNSEEQLRAANRDLEDRVQRRTQQLETSNRELQSMNRELEAFSYTVSHDLRSPLRAIDGFTRILSEEHRAALEPSAQRYLDMVAENARGMGSLIDTMLTFSRLGRQPLTLQKVDATEVAERVAERLRFNTEDRKLNIQIAALPEAQTDPVLLEQLFGNLIGNAVKFTRTREDAHIVVGAMLDPQAEAVAAFFVKDNGVGFDPRYAHKLFGVFQRLHRADEYEGFGAGLAIVERIVTRHGGRAWAESVQGEGATFYFTLSAPAP